MEPNQASSNKVWYLVGAVAVIALAALAFWYFYPLQAPSTSAPEASTSGNTVGSNSGTTAASLSAELNQVPDDSAALNQDSSASAAAVGSF